MSIETLDFQRETDIPFTVVCAKIMNLFLLFFVFIYKRAIYGYFLITHLFTLKHKSVKSNVCIYIRKGIESLPQTLIF